MSTCQWRAYRGASSVVALLFLTLFSTLALSFTAMTDVNLQMSRNHDSMSAAQATSESGLAWGHVLVSGYLEEMEPSDISGGSADAKAMAMFNDFADYVALNFDGTSVINYGTAQIVEFEEPGGVTGSSLVLPVVTLEPGGQASFELSFRQYDETPEFLQVISEGRLGEISRSVRMEYIIEAGSASIFDFALFARDEVSLNNSVKVEAYNFLSGDTRPAQVGTNSTAFHGVTLDNSITVEGDILVGPDGDPEDVIYMNNSIDVTGETGNLEASWDMPDVTVPAAAIEGVSFGNITGDATINTSGTVDSINLDDATLSIGADVTLYVTGDVVIGNSANLEILDSPGASLKLYVAGDLSVVNSGRLNNFTEEPRNLQIYGLPDCEMIHFINSADFYGTIYAPDTDLHLDNSVKFYGAAVGNTVLLDNSIEFYYDASLRNFTPQGVAGDIGMQRDGNSYVEL